MARLLRANPRWERCAPKPPGWVAAALLAAAGLAGQGQWQAQDGALLPPIGSPPPRSRFVRGATAAAAPPAPFELILDPPPQAPAAPAPKAPAAAPLTAPPRLPAPDD